MKILNTTLLFTLFVSSSTFAQSLSSRFGDYQPKKELRLKNMVELSLETTSWNYLEVNSESGEKFMSDSGRLYGLHLDANTTSSGLYFGFKGRIVGGKTAYDGFLQNEEGKIISPYASPSYNYIFQGRVDLGLDIGDALKSRQFTLIPSIGLQRRVLVNPEQDSDPYDYTRVATYTTLPIGAKLSFQFSRDSAFSISAYRHYGFSGSTKSYGSGNEGATRKYIQKDGTGEEVNGSFYFKSFSRPSFIKIAYTSWSVEDSQYERETERTISYEPKNTTKETSLNFGVVF